MQVSWPKTCILKRICAQTFNVGQRILYYFCVFIRSGVQQREKWVGRSLQSEITLQVLVQASYTYSEFWVFKTGYCTCSSCKEHEIMWTSGLQEALSKRQFENIMVFNQDSLRRFFPILLFIPLSPFKSLKRRLLAEKKLQAIETCPHMFTLAWRKSRVLNVPLNSDWL